MAKSSKPRPGKRDLPDGVVAASNGRVPMGASAYALTQDASGKDFAYGTMVRKGNSKGSVLPDAGTATHRFGRTAEPNRRARFGVSVMMPAGPDPQLTSQTQSNGRIMRSAVRRQRPDFYGGMAGAETHL